MPFDLNRETEQATNKQKINKQTFLLSISIQPDMRNPAPKHSTGKRPYLVGLGYFHRGVALSIGSCLLSCKKCSIWKKTHALIPRF